jgi:hypothetical protein
MPEHRHGILRPTPYGGAATTWDRRRPTLNADGSLHLIPEDGQVVEAGTFHGNIQETLAMTVPLVVDESNAERAMAQRHPYRVTATLTSR